MPVNARGQDAPVRMNHETRGLAAPQNERQRPTREIEPT